MNNSKDVLVHLQNTPAGYFNRSACALVRSWCSRAAAKTAFPLSAKQSGLSISKRFSSEELRHAVRFLFLNRGVQTIQTIYKVSQTNLSDPHDTIVRMLDTNIA